VSRNQSPNWGRNKALAFKKSGSHAGYPFDEGTPRSRRGRPEARYEIVTAWGERVKNARVWYGFEAVESDKWDVTECVSTQKNSRIHLARERSGSCYLGQSDVAGWRLMEDNEDD
jgi:hypothetical protein